MVKMSRVVAAALLLGTPVMAQAQGHLPQSIAAFVGPTKTYTISGCGNGRLSLTSSQLVPILCLSGTATVGTIASSGGGFLMQTVLDLTGTRQSGFAGSFFDLDYSNYGLDATYRFADGRTQTGREDFLPVGPVGRNVVAYISYYMVGTANGSQLLPDGLTYGPSGTVGVGYVPAPGSSSIFGESLYFNVAVTQTPEPATLALTLSGLALLGGIAARRRGVA